MNTFLRKGFHEYVRQADLKRHFNRHNEQIARLFENPDFYKSFDSSAKYIGNEEILMLLLTPLVEVAWADGRVTSRESDAILQTADTYGLTEFEDIYCALMETMISRPSPKMTARNWHRLGRLLSATPPREFEKLCESLLVQAQFVAERSSNNLMGFLRGDGICRDEETVLQKIGAEFEDARRRRTGGFEKEFENLLPLVPLVKVAWAEGRITDDEREVILGAAARFGVAPETAGYERLLGWLEFHPTDDFYNESLEVLRRRWQRLDPQEQELRSLDVLSDCALVAEASDGDPHLSAGGERVCEAERAALRQIAEKLGRDKELALS